VDFLFFSGRGSVARFVGIFAMGIMARSSKFLFFGEGRDLTPRRQDAEADAEEFPFWKRSSVRGVGNGRGDVGLARGMGDILSGSAGGMGESADFV
jgi:hypothetical protein